MLVDEAALLARWPAGSSVADIEPLGLRPGSAEHWTLSVPGGDGPRREELLVRRGRDAEHAENLLAVMDALSRHPGPWTTARAVSGDALVEPWIEGLTALAIQPHPDYFAFAMDCIAALHDLPVSEGLDWGRGPAELVPGEVIELFRLGYASHEREAAAPGLAAAKRAVLESPFGFSHRALTANHMLLTTDGAFIVDFETAGFGPQLFDIAAYLLTAGPGGGERRELATRYARARKLDPETTADLADLAGLLWGLDWLVGLPRRQIVEMGDDVKSEQLRLMASRIDSGIREPAGAHPAADAVRRALWGRIGS